MLACLDGYMNIAMEQTEEYVDGQLKSKYGDCFIRGNNGVCKILYSYVCDFVIQHNRTCCTYRAHFPVAPMFTLINSSDVHLKSKAIVIGGAVQLIWGIQMMHYFS